MPVRSLFQKSFSQKSFSSARAASGSYAVLFFGILTVGGLLFGVIAWLVLPDAFAAQLRSYLYGQLDTFAASCTLRDTVLQIGQVNFMDFVRVYLCGICLLGIPLLILFLFLKCFSIGFSICMLLQSSAALFLSRMLYVPVLVLAVYYGCRFSLSMLRNNLQSPVRQLLQYTLLFVLLLLGALLASLADGVSTYYYLQQL